LDFVRIEIGSVFLAKLCVGIELRDVLCSLFVSVILVDLFGSCWYSIVVGAVSSVQGHVVRIYRCLNITMVWWTQIRERVHLVVRSAGQETVSRGISIVSVRINPVCNQGLTN
jgi:hypothetical protein